MEPNMYAVNSTLCEILTELEAYWDVPRDCPTMKKLIAVRLAINPNKDLDSFLAGVREELRDECITE